MRKPLPIELVNEDIRAICAAIKEHVRPLEAYLFGSAAEGAMTDQSDYDILIVVDDATNLKACQKAYCGIRKSLTKRPIDVVWFLKSEFERKKIMGGVALVAFNEGKRLI